MLLKRVAQPVLNLEQREKDPAQKCVSCRTVLPCNYIALYVEKLRLTLWCFACERGYVNYKRVIQVIKSGYRR